MLHIKLQHFFPNYEDYFLNLTTTCQPELLNYFNYISTPECSAPCACAADCLLKDLSPTMQSNLTSAQVLLALVPAICVFIGPSIAEFAVVSTYKPWLTVVLAMGSPATNITRIFGTVDLLQPLNKVRSSLSVAFTDWLFDQATKPWVRKAVEVACYVAALAALANNVQNSVLLDLKTISGWRCSLVMMPLLWSLLAIACHGFGMLSIRCRNYGTKGLLRSFRDGMARPPFRTVKTSSSTPASEILSWLASVCVVSQMVFGIFDLGSLLFVSALEALWVANLYFLNAAVCQVIILVQLAMLRHELESGGDRMSDEGSAQMSKSSSNEKDANVSTVTRHFTI